MPMRPSGDPAGEGNGNKSATTISRQSDRRARVRIGMVASCFVLVFAGLLVRLGDISFTGIADAVPRLADGVKDQPRPEIVDRNGVLLATNLPTNALEINGKAVWDVDETVNALAFALEGLDRDWLRKKLEAGRYAEVRSDLTPREQAAVFALGLPGVIFSQRAHRYYPQDGLAPHLIGYVEGGAAKAGEGGIAGLEYVLDRKSEDGPLVASIDVRAQLILEQVLGRRMEEFSAEAAWGGVLDVFTGEVIAMASFPEFNLNDPVGAPAAHRRNRFTYDRYDLGSAFKVITAASTIEAGLATEETPYDARGGFPVGGGFTVKDFHGKNRVLTLSEVVQHSSNIGVARMAVELGPERQQEYLSLLGFFDSLSIELRERRKPDLPAKWGPVEAATVSYGHGIAVTPLHLLAGFAATINDGVYRVPTFLSRSTVARPVQGHRVFAPDTVAAMRRILRRTVVNGTAGRAEVDGYFPIGKTATADKPGRGGYLKDARISSFVGAFPGYAPRYAVLISLDNPQPTEETHGYATAGWTAAPAFHDLVERLAPVLGVPMANEGKALEAFLSPKAIDHLQAPPATSLALADLPQNR